MIVFCGLLTVVADQNICDWAGSVHQGFDANEATIQAYKDILIFDDPEDAGEQQMPWSWD